MEKIFSFFKKNPVLIIALIVVILMMLKPKKSKRVTEKFSSPDDTEFQRLIREAKTSCDNTCTGPTLEAIDGTRTFNYCPTNNDVTISDYQNAYKNILDQDTIECPKSDETNDTSDITSSEPNKLTNTYYYTNNAGKMIYSLCSESCAISDSNKKYYCPDSKKTDEKSEFERTECLSQPFITTIVPAWKNCLNKDSKSCDKLNNLLLMKKNKNDESIQSMLSKTFDDELKSRKGNSIHGQQNIQNFANKNDGYNERLKIAFNKILNLKDKHLDILNKKSINNDSRQSLNYNVYLNICIQAYKDAIEDCYKYIKSKTLYDQDQLKKELNNVIKKKDPSKISEIYKKILTKKDIDRLNSKKKAVNDITVNVINNLKDKGILEIIFEENTQKFINDMETFLGIKINTTERFTNGVSYDENGNLREHQGAGMPKASYLITALTKTKLLSIGQVYQLRKLMLEAFKVVTNRPFFHFYYENFKQIADMLVKENRLSEILPNMLKCIDLSKNGQFDLAFEQYLLTARQAYQICKDMGMDTKDLEDKFDKLDGTIDVLPEPNNLFVENGFREALKSC